MKARLYAAAGVRDAWLVDPDAETIEVFDLPANQHGTHGNGERALSKAIPGFAVDVAGLFSV